MLNDMGKYYEDCQFLLHSQDVKVLIEGRVDPVARLKMNTVKCL